MINCKTVRNEDVCLFYGLFTFHTSLKRNYILKLAIPDKFMIAIYMPKWIWACDFLSRPLSISSFQGSKRASNWIYPMTRISHSLPWNVHIFWCKSQSYGVGSNSFICAYNFLNLFVQIVITDMCLLPIS